MCVCVFEVDTNSVVPADVSMADDPMSPAFFPHKLHYNLRESYCAGPIVPVICVE